MFICQDDHDDPSPSGEEPVIPLEVLPPHRPATNTPPPCSPLHSPLLHVYSFAQSCVSLQVELHVHLDGSVRVQTIVDVAQ